MEFNNKWRFTSPEHIPQEFVWAVSSLISKIASQGSQFGIFEHFKSYFAGPANASVGMSSNESWAETDLNDYMRSAAENAPLFIEAFYDGCQKLIEEYPSIGVPDVEYINQLLAEHKVGYYIDPPKIIKIGNQTEIPMPKKIKSLNDEANEMIQKSFLDADNLLYQNKPRLAVQEIMWLLESVATIFDGLKTDTGTVTGKYFNNIANDLRRHYKNTVLEQALVWMKSLHGYLSSPTGGRVRHGTNLKEGIEVSLDDATLYCNLTKAYITFLIHKYEHLSKINKNS